MTKHEEAGLVFSGLNEDGEKEWIGTDKQWNKYKELVEEEKIDLDDFFPETRQCEMCGELTPVELLSGVGDKEICQDCQAKFE